MMALNDGKCGFHSVSQMDFQLKKMFVEIP